MPLYSIKGPDGKTYSINGPAGASRDEVISAIQNQLSQQEQARLQLILKLLNLLFHKIFQK